jgi:hypothetical protein
MPIKALRFKPGIFREGTSYSQEGSWFDCDKVRFHSGLPEKIGGWERLSAETYAGICRRLFVWSSLGGIAYMGVGTHLKFYIQQGGEYFDVTPVRSSVVLNNPFATTNGSPTVTVTDVAHGALDNDYVTFSGAAAVAGLDLNAEYQITFIDADSYTITAASNANATVAAGGGATVTAAYQVNTGPSIMEPLSGWGAGAWGSGAWSTGEDSTNSLQVWNCSNFGEDLVFGPRGGGIYYWDTSGGLENNRGVNISALAGASDTPSFHNHLLVSDVSRFVLLFGADAFAGPVELDPMLIRWSDQESAADWTPSITSKAGELRLSNGSHIVTAIQMRQEIVVFTDTATYSMQYHNAPVLWGAQLISGSTSIIGPNVVGRASGILYWMGYGKFFIYDGRVDTLPCDVLQYIFDDFNYDQLEQVHCGACSQFDEVWWFYCSAASDQIDRYAVYNYELRCWYIGSLERTAWVDAGIYNYPVAASETTSNLVFHEFGDDDNSTAATAGIEAYIESAQFTLGDDGDRFMLVNKVIPDMTFRNSSAVSPSATVTLKPLKNSGSGYNDPKSVGGSSEGSVTRTASAPIEEYTEQVYLRARGRQMVVRFESTGTGVQWQLGVPRLEMRPDGRRG